MMSVRLNGITLFLSLLALLVAGCNLQPITPTPTLAPPTFEPLPPAADPITDPLAATVLPNGGVSPNPNCPTTPPGWITYIVEPGDSLGLLASQTESTVQELVDGNCLVNPDQIEVGSIIFLPRQPVIG